MKTLFTTAVLLLSLVLSQAEMQPPIPLWSGGVPGALGTNSNDIPTLTPYLPDVTKTTDLTRQNNRTPRQRAVWNTATRGSNSLKRQSSATGAAMVICPGGGYVGLAPHEGNDYALWLNQHWRDLLRPEIPARLQRLPLSGGISGRGTRDALGAGARGRNTKLIRTASASWARRRAGIWRRRC